MGRRGSAGPSVSVVIPARNDAGFLARCLYALDAQTVRPLEVIVVDNGSGDRTGGIGRRYDATVVVQHEPGIPATAAMGYDTARGDVIARLDADSTPPHDWVERITAAFADDPRLDGLTGPGDFSTLSRIPRAVAGLLYMRAYFSLMGLVLGHPPLFGSNFAMRRGLWEATRPRVAVHDREVHDDLDLSAQLAPGSVVRVDPSLRVRVSSRPFTRPGPMVRRVWRAVRTLSRPRPRRRADPRSW